MSLYNYELDIMKQQLGYPLTRVGAEPYIAYAALFDNVVQPYLYDNSTTSSTTVAAAAGNIAVTVAANPAAPNNAASLVFAVGASVVVDVGLAQETTTISAIAGLSFTMNLVNAHTAPWPLYINGAEWAIRGILARIATIEGLMSSIAPKIAGLSQVDEAKAYASSKGAQRGATRDTFDSLNAQRMQARDDLAGALGIPNLWRVRQSQGGAARVEAY